MRNRQRQESECRGEILKRIESLRNLLDKLMGRSPLIRGSVYERRRECGKLGCRCKRGSLHRGEVIAVREKQRRRVKSLEGLDERKVKEYVDQWRWFRRYRGQMVETFGSLVGEVDRLSRLREINLLALK